MQTACFPLQFSPAGGPMGGNCVNPVGSLRMIALTATNLKCPKGKGTFTTCQILIKSTPCFVQIL